MADRYTSWHDLPPERHEEVKRNHRRRAKLRQMGKPCLVPSGPTIQRVRALHDECGMTFREIALRAPLKDGKPLAGSTVSDLYRGFRNPGRGGGPIERIPRTTQDRIFAVAGVFQEDSKAQVPILGTKRRMQALACAGYGGRYIATELGHADQNMVWRMMVGYATHRHTLKYVFASTRTQVCSLYEKLIYVDPADMGLSPMSIGRAKGAARRHGWAPAQCWDADTIDDPDALPEWTGACGTREGYGIHVRETVFRHNYMPPCDACRQAVEAFPISHREVIAFRHDRFAAILDERGINPRQLAVKLYGARVGTLTSKELAVKADAMYRWRTGDRSPRTRGLIETVAAALEVSVSELIDVEETKRKSTPLPGDGRFNPFFFRAVLEQAGMSQRAAADLPGSTVSRHTIENWMKGRASPSEPSKLKAFADHFGVDTGVFYL